MSRHSAKPARPDPNDRAEGAKARGPAPPGHKRERILEAALRVFASKGFFGAKVADIAAEAGVADGTIYLYFKSKDDLLISLFEHQMQLVNEALVLAMAGAETATDKLARFAQTYVALVENHPQAAEVITVELRQSAKFMKEYKNPRFAEFLKILAGVIEDGQRRGEFANDIPAPVCARALFGMLDELALMWVTGKSEHMALENVSGWVCRLVSK